MPRNLRNKIMNLLEDISTLDKYEAADRIEEFVKRELEFLETEHVIGRWEIVTVHSQAIQKWQKYDPRHLGENANHDNFRAWCYIEATINLLKRLGLLSASIRYDRYKK